jgi:NAD(P) transhydrogenase subunit alpha
MNIAVLRETGSGEARVALMPDSVQKLVAQKVTVSIESGAGLGAARTDEDYTAAGATVVAEGIETEDEAMAALETGAHYGQGYLFAKPMPEREVAEFLAKCERVAAAA